jgi:uncharacterized protein YggE
VQTVLIGGIHDPSLSRCPTGQPFRLAAVSFSAGWAALFGLTAPTAHAAGASEAAPSAVVVSGTSEVFAAPDRAMVSLGAVVEAKQALDAQKQLGQVMQRVIKDIKAQGIPDEKSPQVCP